MSRKQGCGDGQTADHGAKAESAAAFWLTENWRQSLDVAESRRAQYRKLARFPRTHVAAMMAEGKKQTKPQMVIDINQMG